MTSDTGFDRIPVEHTRRVVAGVLPDGSAGFLSDGGTPKVVTVHPEGQEQRAWVTSFIWSSDETSTMPHAGPDPVATMSTFFPAINGVKFFVSTIEPGGHTDNLAELDLYKANLAAAGIDMAVDFVDEGNHATTTLDFAVVVSGEFSLRVGEEEVQLEPGDCVVQTGNVHAWSNRGDTPATVAFVLLGARGRPGAG